MEIGVISTNYTAKEALKNKRRKLFSISNKIKVSNQKERVLL